MPKVDLETMTTKQFIALLSKKMGGVDLSKKKKFIKAQITEILDAMAENEEEEESSSEEEEEESSSEEEQPKKKARKSGGGGGGLSAVKEISDTLAGFLGKGKQMARTEVVKSLWDYIKENDLQNPNDRREILLDDAMQAVFGVDRFTMFSMNKYVGAHIHPFKPVELNSSTPKKKRETAKKGSASKKKAKTQRKQGTQAPYRLSEKLAAVVGTDVLPRPQVIQGLWAYIRSNGLQNPDDKREILCDEKLKAVMGGKNKVTMFSMNKYVTPHMLEKLDKSEYTHVEQPKNSNDSDSDDSHHDDSDNDSSDSS